VNLNLCGSDTPTQTQESDPKRSFGSIRWTYELALDFGRPEREVATDRAIKAW